MNQVRQRGPERGPITRVFIGIWDAMNFTRRLVFNLLFFTLLILMLALLFGSEGVKPLLDRTTLVIAPDSRLVEQYTCDRLGRQFFGSSGDGSCAEVQTRDVLRALAAAKDDKRIERVLLRVDRLQVGGYGSLREIADAIAAVRASGKQVVSFGEGWMQGQYLLAAQADEVYLDPMGAMFLEGLDRYRQYYREGLQDKLGVDVHLFKVGEYKSAAEPYVLDAASPQAKEADLFWMNDVWQRYLADVARVRDLTPQAIAAGIDTLPEGLAAANGDLAKFALQQKLVDGLKTEQEVDALLIERGVADEDAEGGFRQVTLEGYLQHIDSGLAATDPRPQVAVIVAEGEIAGGDQPAGTVGGDSTAALLRQARDDDHVKAVVLRVDSPGGEVFASEQIRREVVALKDAGKPVVASMGDLAASGGYWIAMDADRIYANPSTITGSIGIFGLIPTLPRTLDKIGVHTDGVGTTRFAGAFDITRALDPAVGDVIQSVIDKGYRDFTGKVARARNRSVEQIDLVARGRVWSGAQAKERGLVDAFGGLQAAIADAAGRARLGKPDAYRVRYVEDPISPFEKLLGDFAQTRIGHAWFGDSAMIRGLLASKLPQVASDLRFLDGALKPGVGTPVKALVYCFCGF